jgi:hypothetical protein
MIVRSLTLWALALGVFTLACAKPTVVPKPAVTLINASGRPFEVRDVVDISDESILADFWSLIPPARGLGPAVTPWAHAVIRDYFFGRCAPLYAPPDLIFGSAKGARPYERLLNLPRATGKLGMDVDPARPTIVADDIPHRPILRSHVNVKGHVYSARYYPRRMHDWVMNELQAGFLLTGDSKYRDRARELISFLLYSQYQPDGRNAFVNEFYPEDHKQLTATGSGRRWRGGWDYLFDWRWKDSYGYQWSLHEPDHHVGSEIAATLLLWYRFEGDDRYIEAASEFIRNQVPDYGFHRGVWRGRNYYWTQYSRSGTAAASTSATDNVVAHVARPIAMLGYYRNDPVLLEYARGLLWYLVREWEVDGRWYYDGAENPKNQRKSISHEMDALEPSMITLAYLSKAGLPIDELLEPFQEAVTWLRENLADLSQEKYVHGWQIVNRDDSVVFLQATGRGATSVAIKSEHGRIRKITRLVHVGTTWREESTSEIGSLKRGDIVKVEYAGLVEKPISIEATVNGGATVTKEARLVPPDLKLDAREFPTFPERMFFPERL